MVRPRDRRAKEFAELAAGTVRVAVVEYEHLAETLERIAREDDRSARRVDLMIGELGAVFQVVAGQIEQVRSVRAQLERSQRRA